MIEQRIFLVVSLDSEPIACFSTVQAAEDYIKEMQKEEEYTFRKYYTEHCEEDPSYIEKFPTFEKYFDDCGGCFSYNVRSMVLDKKPSWGS